MTRQKKRTKGAERALGGRWEGVRRASGGRREGSESVESVKFQGLEKQRIFLGVVFNHQAFFEEGGGNTLLNIWVNLHKFSSLPLNLQGVILD